MATVKDLLIGKRDAVASIVATATALDAAHLMNDRHIGSLVVVDNQAGDKVIGIVTERDILRRVVALDRSPAGVAVREVMSAPVACCRPDTTLAECRGVMTNKRIRHLPVVEDGRLVGIVTIGDLMAQQIDEHQSTIEYLYEYLYSPPAPHGGDPAQ